MKYLILSALIISIFFPSCKNERYYVEKDGTTVYLSDFAYAAQTQLVKSYSNSKQPARHPGWFQQIDSDSSLSDRYLNCLKKIKRGTDKAFVDSNYALMRYAELNLPKGAADDIKHRIFTGLNDYFSDSLELPDVFLRSPKK